VALLPDGRITVVGSSTGTGAGGSPQTYAGAVLKPDGSLDTRYGYGGLLTGEGFIEGTATDVVVQPDGRILTVGDILDADTGNRSIQVIRTDPNVSGTNAVDTSYDGEIAFDFGDTKEEFAAGAAIQPDGKVVVVGGIDSDDTGDFDVGVFRLNADANFFVAGNSNDRGGVRVAAKDADGDTRAEVVAGSGEGSSANVRVYLGKNFTGAAEPGAFQDIAVFGGAGLPGGVFVG
jgi:hypothetical protein